MSTDPRRAVDAAPPIRFAYAGRADPGDPACLAVFAYGRGPADAAALRVPLVTPEGGVVYERWTSSGLVQRRRAFGADIAEDGRLLFASWVIDEAGYAEQVGEQVGEQVDAPGGIAAAAEAAYRQIEALRMASGYPHLVKVWHTIDALNEGAGDDERYRRFCIGRARALKPGLPLPAATAVGAQRAAGQLVVFLLAAKEAGTRIENPRQVPAYEYPRDYGPVSPSFSRAMLMPWGQLFVSGTAAVVGYESRHPDSAGAQLRELALNLDALATRAEAVSGQRLTLAALKFFVRRPADIAEVEALAARLFVSDCPRLTVLADISRAELRVEAEALYDPAR